MNLSGEDFNFKFYIQAVHELNHTVTICVINVLLSATALFGNAVILITIWKTSSLHSASYMLLSSLAVSDLFVGLVVQPLFALFLLFNNFDPVPLHISAVFLTLVSLMNVTAIAIDRFLALRLHLRYNALVTTSRVKLILICIWLFSAVVSIPYLGLKYFRPLLLLQPAIFLCLLVGNFIAYSKIYFIVRRHQSQIQLQRHPHQRQQENNGNLFSVVRLKKSAANSFLVYTLLLFCYFPYTVYVGLCRDTHGNSPTTFNTMVTLVFLNSSLNPILYCWRDRQIRTALKQLYFKVNSSLFS